jgi:dsRNA-specific ribonuclease
MKPDKEPFNLELLLETLKNPNTSSEDLDCTYDYMHSLGDLWFVMRHSIFRHPNLSEITLNKMRKNSKYDEHFTATPEMLEELDKILAT